MNSSSLQTFTISTALALMLGWLLFIGQNILLPITLSVISVYVLSSCTDKMATMPLIGRTYEWMRRLAVLLAFLIAIAFLMSLIATNVESVINALPGYQENLNAIINRSATLLGFSDAPTWDELQNRLLDRINLQTVATSLLTSLSSLGSMIFMIFLYTSFLLAERGSFAEKLIRSSRNQASADQMLAMVRDVNRRIGDYLAIKTLINVILAGVSYGIMLLLGIDFPAFWAVLIGLLNYIPYVGSFIGVIFPVVLSIAQFGSIPITLATLTSLTAAQLFVGNVLEPKWIGRTVNLSPFVVLVALSFWTALWGLPGAILAVPLTSILVIIFAAAPATRPIAIMLSTKGEV